MLEPPIAALVSFTLSACLVIGCVAATYIIPVRWEKPSKILRKLKYLAERSSSDGCITVFDLATEAEINALEARKILDRYCQELDGEKLVSAKGEIYYVFPRGAKINQQEELLKLESATDSRITRLELRIGELQQELSRLRDE